MPTLSNSSRRALAVACIFVGHGMGFGVWAASVPRLRDLWALRDGPLGVVLLSVGLGAMAAMPLGGVLMGRVGASRVAPVAGIAVSLLLAAPAACHALGLPPLAAWIVLLASAAAIGVTAGLTDIAMNAEASVVELRAGHPIMSRLHGSWSFGVFIGGGLAAALAWLGLGTAATMAGAGVVEAALMVVGGAVMWRGPAERAAPAAAKVRRSPLRPLLALGLMAALCFELEGALADWSGVFLRDVHGVSPASAAAAYSGVAFAMMMARFGGDAVRRAIGPIAMTRAGGILAACAMAVGLMSNSVPLTVAAFAVVGLGVANIVPVVISAAGARAGASGIAAVASVGYAGLLIGPPVIGFVAQAVGLPVALWLIVAGGITLAALAVAVRPPAVVRPASDLLLADDLARRGGV